ncbi:bifunctional DNA primase/polymerase [Streptomyces sp. B1866]|uniref:bifunctional DNA primase/polymerase n=1 Tax=Streptomyces sp. B1866 TaxID=3075431 RepID=UPI00289104BB|nr:bifunctional DNA primase/polymerase [Streptomyces sp. B1866]MDT3399278.1 bifunctional DNA primase/polymerase [Streptomyces sp. B1866]
MEHKGGFFSRWLRRPRSRADGGEGTGPGAGAREDLLLAAAAAGFPLATAAHPAGYGCSCDRVGCPTPARHPVSFAWRTQATADPEKVTQWLRAVPQANFVTATGIAHDVLDVPVEAGRLALEKLGEAGVEVGPVATSTGPDLGQGRMLFFTATRGTPEDEDEWWPCELDCHPETMDEHPGLRWHCRGSYVLLPPARLPGDGRVAWLLGPERPLPDPLTLLEALTDACARFADEERYEVAAWPSR